MDVDGADDSLLFDSGELHCPPHGDGVSLLTRPRIIMVMCCVPTTPVDLSQLPNLDVIDMELWWGWALVQTVMEPGATFSPAFHLVFSSYPRWQIPVSQIGSSCHLIPCKRITLILLLVIPSSSGGPPLGHCFQTEGPRIHCPPGRYFPLRWALSSLAAHPTAAAGGVAADATRTQIRILKPELPRRALHESRSVQITRRCFHSDENSSSCIC